MLKLNEQQYYEDHKEERKLQVEVNIVFILLLHFIGAVSWSGL